MSAAAAQDASSTAALVAYLRCEADIAELKAKRLRQQADALAQEHGDPIFTIYSPEEMAPLDEFGVPKYKGMIVTATCCCCDGLVSKVAAPKRRSTM